MCNQDRKQPRLIPYLTGTSSKDSDCCSTAFMTDFFSSAFERMFVFLPVYQTPVISYCLYRRRSSRSSMPVVLDIMVGPNPSWNISKALAHSSSVCFLYMKTPKVVSNFRGSHQSRGFLFISSCSFLYRSFLIQSYFVNNLINFFYIRNNRIRLISYQYRILDIYWLLKEILIFI